MPPNTSKRKYIKWGDEPAHEDTSTIVLTSHQNFYVDIRLLLNPTLSSISSQFNKLQWAFAGTADSIIKENGCRNTTWTHFVDNKSKTPEKDAGDMFAQEDGDTLERGVMAHPATGKITAYEELWTDLDIEGPFNELGEEKKVCVVLKLDKGEAKGLVVRIGGRIQGVVRVDEKFDLGIWRFDSINRQWEKTESFAKASPLSIASVLFQVKEADFMDEGSFIQGGSVIAKDQIEAEDPEFLSFDYNHGWEIVEKFLY